MIAFEREHILSEIRRTAAENGGVPLDVDRFFAETGVKESDWQGIFWARWADALQDAGVQPYRPLAASTESDWLVDYDPLRKFWRW